MSGLGNLQISNICKIQINFWLNALFLLDITDRLIFGLLQITITNGA